MGCNCGKDKTKLSIRKKIRQGMKEKISDLKKLWEESKKSGETTVITNKRNLNFK